MRETRYREAEQAYWAAYGVERREETVVELPGVGTRARVQLIGEGAPLLFVHGGPNAGTTWAPLVSRLLHRRCIVLDRPGCGLSPRVDYSRASFQEIAATILAETLDGLGVERADVVASSVGGTWGLWFADRHPSRVGTITQMGCVPFIPEMDMKAAIFLRLLSLPFLGAVFPHLPQTRGGVSQTFRSMGHGPTLDAGRFPDEFFHWAKSLFSDTDTMRNERGTVQKGMTFRAMRPEVILTDEFFRSISHRTHWFWGANDPFGSVAAAERIVALMPDASLDVVPDAGHLPWLDEPERAASSVGSGDGTTRAMACFERTFEPTRDAVLMATPD